MSSPHTRISSHVQDDPELSSSDLLDDGGEPASSDSDIDVDESFSIDVDSHPTPAPLRERHPSAHIENSHLVPTKYVIRTTYSL
jgi:hypothetical protein